MCNDADELGLGCVCHLYTGIHNFFLRPQNPFVFKKFGLITRIILILGENAVLFYCEKKIATIIFGMKIKKFIRLFRVY